MQQKPDNLWLGIYRALVIDDRDPVYRGRVKVWCPDFMPTIEKTDGLWALPANNPMGGRNIDQDNNNNDHFFQGSCLIPPKGSWVLVFFEYGNPLEPRYLCAADIGNCKVPIENQLGEQYQKKWTLFKSRRGRVLIVSDDPWDERVEITGKKRQLRSVSNQKQQDPSGNKESVYEIDGNQTTILIDDRDGYEKVLIRDFHGNFIKLDTKDDTLHIGVRNEIRIESGTNIHVRAGGDIRLEAGGDFHVETGVESSADDKKGVFSIRAKDDFIVHSHENIWMKSDESFVSQSQKDFHIKAKNEIKQESGSSFKVTSGEKLHLLSTDHVYVDGSQTHIQSKRAQPANASDALDAQGAFPAPPDGGRYGPYFEDFSYPDAISNDEPYPDAERISQSVLRDQPKKPDGSEFSDNSFGKENLDNEINKSLSVPGKRLVTNSRGYKYYVLE